jgi:hypothetical protein
MGAHPEDGLGCELTADPVGFLCEDDGPTEPQCRQRRGDSTKSTADDEYICVPFASNRTALLLLRVAAHRPWFPT